MRGKHRQAGFVVSTEMMLIALILALGLVTGWLKMRDQSLAELKDWTAAIDVYIMGSRPAWYLGGTRWISGGTIVEPSIAGPATEKWGPASNLTVSAGQLVPLSTDTYRTRDGFLVYGSVPPPSTSVSGTGENGVK